MNLLGYINSSKNYAAWKELSEDDDEKSVTILGIGKPWSCVTQVVLISKQKNSKQ